MDKEINMILQERKPLPSRKIPQVLSEARFMPTERSTRTRDVLDMTDDVLAGIDAVLNSTQAPDFSRRPFRPITLYEATPAKDYKTEKAKLSWQSSTKEYVDFFKSFHKEEGLPQDWQKLQYGNTQVGFSMDGQMNLLKGDDPESRKIWAKQTRQDLQGFVIEYLSPYIVYPWRHEKKFNPDGSANLVDSRYGGKKMVDTVSDDERGGAVKKVIKAIDKAVVNKQVPDGSIFVQWSPMDDSPTGLKQDNGNGIVYSDTHLIISQVDGDKLNGVTIKTDLTQTECREMIQRLTGKEISVGAPVEDYINSVALIDPAQGGIASVQDVVTEAAKVREDLSFGSTNAYKDKSWEAVREQVKKGDKLYKYTDRMQTILERFEENVINDNPSAEELSYYIAAAVLRISHEAQEAEQRPKQASMERYKNNVSYHGGNALYGDILRDTALRPGCAGGGAKKTAISGTFGVSRAVDAAGSTGGLCPEIKCGGCSWKADEKAASEIQSGSIKNCPECGWSPK